MAEVTVELEDIANELVEVLPWQFEPRPSEHNRPNAALEVDDGSDSNDMSAEENARMINTYWCECGQCTVQPTPTECLCCYEVDAILEKVESIGLECVTSHPTFRDNCLNIRVLEVNLYEYVDQEGPLDDNEPINRVYRHIAYRRFARWIWQRLGKRNRRVLPACVVTQIRNSFPSEEHTGFLYPRPR